MNTNDQGWEPVGIDDLIRHVAIVARRSYRFIWLFGALFVIIGAYKFYRAAVAPPTYEATYTFMRDDPADNLSGVASILGQIGFRGGRSRFNLDRVVELARSRRIVQSTLLDSLATHDSSQTLIANEIIQQYDLSDKWADEKGLDSDFKFQSTDVDSFNDLELWALKQLYKFVNGEENGSGLVEVTYSEQSTILSLTATTLTEDLSIGLISSLYRNLVTYFILNSTEKQRAVYEIVKSKSDSIAFVLRQTEIEYAKFQDANQNLYSRVAQLKAAQLEREIQKLNIIHAEALKNLEIADFSLRNATPEISALDHPIRPLPPVYESKVKALIYSFLIALGVTLFVAATFYVFRKVKEIE